MKLINNIKIKRNYKIPKLIERILRNADINKKKQYTILTKIKNNI